MNPQTQKPQANYDFIMNQPGSDIAPPKKSAKRIILAGSAVLIVLVLVAAGIYGRIGQNVKQLTPAQRAELLAKQYFNNMGAAKYAEAYALVTQDESKSVTVEQFSTTVGPLLGSIYKFSECSIANTELVESRYVTEANCPYVSDNKTEKFVLEISESESNLSIVKISNPDRVVKQ